MADRNDTVAPGVYRHFKGKLYRVYATATDSETGDRYVFYRALYGEEGFYVRPLEMFLSAVDHKKYPDVEQCERFDFLYDLPGIEEMDRSDCCERRD